jgi:hypothetical protein
MKTSDKYTKVLTAMAEIQEQMTVEPDGENKHLSAKYATLDNILKTIKPVLKEAGLVALQDTDEKDKCIVCTTRIYHVESGEWFEATSTVPIERSSAQGIGSSTTYGRRYSLCTALGIGMNNDDDGNVAEKKLTEAEKKRDAEDRLQKAKGNALPKLMKYDAMAIQRGFEESGYVSDEEDKETSTIELIKQVNTYEKLVMIGQRVKGIDAEIKEATK